MKDLSDAYLPKMHCQDVLSAKHVYLPLYLIIEIQEKRPWHVVEKSACIRDEYNLFHV